MKRLTEPEAPHPRGDAAFIRLAVLDPPQPDSPRRDWQCQVFSPVGDARRAGQAFSERRVAGTAQPTRSRWRERLGAAQLVALIQESLSVAPKIGAIETKDLERVVVDATVQPQAAAHPTDARLMHRAIVGSSPYARGASAEATLTQDLSAR